MDSNTLIYEPLRLISVLMPAIMAARTIWSAALSDMLSKRMLPTVAPWPFNRRRSYLGILIPLFMREKRSFQRAHSE